MPFRIEVRKDQWENKLALFKNLPKQLRPATVEVIDYLHGRITRYTSTSKPPPPPGSQYVRTFDLKRGQRKEVKDSGRILGRVFSTGPPYDKKVLAAQTQSQIHRGRWYTYESTVKDEAPTVQEIYHRFIQGKINE